MCEGVCVRVCMMSCVVCVCVCVCVCGGNSDIPISKMTTNSSDLHNTSTHHQDGVITITTMIILEEFLL